MAVFEWKLQTGNSGDPPSAYITVELSVGDVTRQVEGILDTGADYSELTAAEAAPFGISAETAGYIVDARTKSPKLFVMADARIDGNQFRMPISVALEGERQVSLFGRVGVMDHFQLELDPLNQSTQLIWRGTSPGSVLPTVEKHVVDTTGELLKLPKE